MLEKIKKLLDSGCYVEVRTTSYLHKACGINIFGEIIVERGVLYEEDSKCYFRERNELYGNRCRILSIQPIARPLYQYKVGDRVVVLDNSPNRTVKGKEGTILEIDHGTILLKWFQEGGIERRYKVDTKCIAPVLD